MCVSAKGSDEVFDRTRRRKFTAWKAFIVFACSAHSSAHHDMTGTSFNVIISQLTRESTLKENRERQRATTFYSVQETR